jgi:hypothetical protein
MTRCCGRGLGAAFVAALLAEACWLACLVWLAVRS